MFIVYWKVPPQKNLSNINFRYIFCWNYSNNLVQQNPHKDNMSWFMNKTTNADTTVNRYGMTYELRKYCLFCCMMPQLCDSRWLCMPPIWASILYLKSLFFCSLHHRNCETSELKMGPRHTITHSPQTFPHLQRSSNTPHSLSLTRTWSHKGETQESCHLWTTINPLSLGVAFFMFLHNRAWVEALIEKVRE